MDRDFVKIVATPKNSSRKGRIGLADAIIIKRKDLDPTVSVYIYIFILIFGLIF
jgi:hypothetical protein